MVYPCERYTVLPSGKVTQVTVVGQAYPHRGADDPWMLLLNKRIVSRVYLHETAEAAALQFKSQLENQQAKLDKQQDNLRKKMRKVCDEITRIRIARGEGPPNPFENQS